jgi:hypothetical protein
MLKVMGLAIHRWKGIFKAFPTVYYKPKVPKFQLVRPKKNCSYLVIAKQAGQRTAMGNQQRLFFAMFTTSVLKESWAYAYYWWCLLMMFGWSIWWSSILKIPLPKLWILTTLLKKYGDVSLTSPNLSINNQIQPPIDI